MADPFVNFAPAEVGPCTATWFVGADSGSSFNDNPSFGPPAWAFLVDGPLKDVLDKVYPTDDAALSAFAAAGGQITCTVQGAAGQTMQPYAPRVYQTLPPSAGTWWQVVVDSGALPPEALPLRWVVKFSVPHSIIR